MTVNDRIGVIKSRWQTLDRMHRIGTRDEYERAAILMYSDLRETWEQALEEVLRDRVVLGDRRNIRTQQIARLSDITEQDRREFESAVMKCCRWLPEHDQAPAEIGPVAGSDELKRDIEALENWVRTIRRRRR
jgi:hypothetical protein